MPVPVPTLDMAPCWSNPKVPSPACVAACCCAACSNAPLETTLGANADVAKGVLT